MTPNLVSCATNAGDLDILQQIASSGFSIFDISALDQYLHEVQVKFGDVAPAPIIFTKMFRPLLRKWRERGTSANSASE
ncbi:hypothetical protein GCK32_018433 [Trichostrongylus colubriformis]|uniref:Uncharacterized protein n=1 Tax=Trichostrongylus colubriformis TaxID=6319 RepID=A0AAN8FJH6_TRICO